MNPEQAKYITDFLINDFENEVQSTLRVLEAVPADNLDYRPDEKSKTGLALLRHIALEDAWMLNSIADGQYTMPPDDSDACGVMTPADAVARYKASVPPAIRRVREATGEHMAAEIDLLGLMQLPTVAALAMAIKHSVHHRGQLSTYLRAMGGNVPPIYGPTADVPMSLTASS